MKKVTMKHVLSILVCLVILSTFVLSVCAQEFVVLDPGSIFADSCYLALNCGCFPGEVVDAYGNFYVDNDYNSASVSCDTWGSHTAAAGIYGCDVYGNCQYDPTDVGMNEALGYAYASIGFSNEIDHIFAEVAVFCENGQESSSFSY